MARVRPVVTRCAAVLAALIVAACGTGDGQQDTSGGDPGTSAETVQDQQDQRDQADDADGDAGSDTPADVAVPEELKFTAETVNGARFDGASLAGKPAVLWFWAPWCPVCQGEAPTIAEVSGDTEGSVQFVGVAAQDQVPAMREFVSKYGLDGFPHLADTSGDAELWQRFGVTAQPAYAFVSADGTVEVETSALSADQLRDRTDALAR